MVEVTDASFEAEVLRSERPVVVEFWAPWCGPCRALAPLLAELDEAYPDVVFAQLDVDANPLTASRYGVLSLPTVIRFEGSEPAATAVGARSRERLARDLRLPPA